MKSFITRTIDDWSSFNRWLGDRLVRYTPATLVMVLVFVLIMRRVAGEDDVPEGGEMPIEPLIDICEALQNAVGLSEEDNVALVEHPMMVDEGGEAEMGMGQDYSTTVLLQYGLELLSRLFLGEGGEPNEWAYGDDDADPRWLHRALNQRDIV